MSRQYCYIFHWIARWNHNYFRWWHNWDCGKMLGLFKEEHWQGLCGRLPKPPRHAADSARRRPPNLMSPSLAASQNTTEETWGETCIGDIEDDMFNSGVSKGNVILWKPFCAPYHLPIHGKTWIWAIFDHSSHIFRAGNRMETVFCAISIPRYQSRYIIHSNHRLFKSGIQDRVFNPSQKKIKHK